jgi:hypothetical protein
VTLTAMNNLSDSYAAAGRWEEALKMREDVLALSNKQTGELADAHTSIKPINMNAATGAFQPLDLSKIGNGKLNHLVTPPHGNVVLGGVLFMVDPNQHGVVVTAERSLKYLPAEASIVVRLASVSYVHLLLNAVYSKLPIGTEIGRVILEFDNQRKCEFPLRCGKTIRENWWPKMDAVKSLTGDADHGMQWRNVVFEEQIRSEPCLAYIDMLTIAVPSDLRVATLTKITIRNSNDANGAPTGAGLMLMAATAELRSNSASRPSMLPAEK